MELQENREEANPGNSNNNSNDSNNNSYIARTARAQHQDKQIEQLLKEGYTVEDVVYVTRYSRAAVERKASELRWRNKQDADRFEFIFFGGQSPEGGYLGISNR